MSYAQLFRRIRRMLESNVRDALDGLTKEQREMFEFDEELRRGAQRKRETSQSARSSQTRSSAGNRMGGSERNASGASAGASGQQSPHAKRKPGELDDASYLQKLGLTTSATNNEISSMYRRLLSKNHPDRVATRGAAEQERASEKTKEITEAYQIIARRRGIR